jgi:hypothetical protein
MYEKQKFLAFIDKNPDMKFEEICAKYSMQVGISVHTVKVYFQELLNAGAIEAK